MTASTLEHWEDHWKTHPESRPHEELLEAIQRLTTVRGSSVLEVGGGAAPDSIELAKLGARSTVLDFSPEALELAGTNAAKNGVPMLLVQGDAAAAPFRTGSFDVVFSQGLVEHFKNAAPVIDEHARVAKAGGLVVVEVPQTYNLYTLRKAREMRRGTWFAGWETQYSARQLRKIFERVGLDVVAMYGSGTPSMFLSLRNVGMAGTRRIGRPYITRPLARLWWRSWSKLISSLNPYVAMSVGIVGRKEP